MVFLRTKIIQILSSFLADIDYFNDQNKMKLVFDKIYQNEYVVKSSVSSWYDGYITWVNKTHGSTGNVDAGKSDLLIG